MTERKHAFDPAWAVPPGAAIRMTLEAVGMSQADAATRLGISEKHLSRIINGEARVTPDVAVKLEIVLEIPTRFWASAQAYYDELKAKIEQRAQFEAEKERARAYPYAALAKLGAVRATRDAAERTRELLRFLGAASFDNVQTAYSAAFRVASGRTPQPEAVVAWLRLGELEAQRTNVAEYSRDQLVAAIPAIRAATRLPMAQAVEGLRSTLARCGAVLAMVPHLPKTYAHGATYWLSPVKAVVQVSMRGKWEDVFWFSLMHEVGHLVLRHPKKDVLIAWDDGEDLPETEQAANDFAARTLIPPRDLERFLSEYVGAIAGERVEAFAAEIGICPGIVVGRLQHDGTIGHDRLNDLRRRLESDGPKG